MSRIINKEMKCAICGNKSMHRILLSRYVKERYIDGYNTGDEKYMYLLECPFCHFVSQNIEKSESRDNDVVKSEKFIKISKENDDLLRKLKLYAFLTEISNSCWKKAYANLLLYWYCKEKNINGSEYLNKYFFYTEESFIQGEKSDPRSYLFKIIQYIDLLRQSEKYEEAKNTLEKLKQSVKNTEYYDDSIKRILSLEEQLIDTKDYYKHIIE